MTEQNKKACREYEQMILNATKYTGNQEPDVKIFSASMLGNEPLQNYLKFKYGGKENIQFEATTFGSVYQLGIDTAVEKNTDKIKYTSAKRIKIELPNGWIVSGEMDQIDWENEVIFDNKVTTSTTIDKIKSEGKNHQYALQMGVYKWLLKKDAIQKEEEPINFSTVLPIVDKNFSYFKKNKYNQLTFVEVETFTTDEIEQLLIEKTNELDEYINANEEPPKCKEVWPYGRKGEARKPMRCIYYCDFAEHCKYYNSNSPSAINALLDL